ncbi:ninjurin-1-like isoform X1 [Littorina saxatilis]|uniref:Ninjurin-1 n=1 Tax=Littorina saxatilis TaxID=31220 RepID=A0AAN9BB71_9CAEN
MTTFSCTKCGYSEMLEMPEFPGEKPFVPSKAYATRKTIAQGALDLALLMANASQLKALVDIPANHRNDFYVGLLVLIGLSIALQLAAGIILLVLGMTNPKDEEGHKRTECLNNSSVSIILLITVVNIFISAIGISYVENESTP